VQCVFLVALVALAAGLFCKPALQALSTCTAFPRVQNLAITETCSVVVDIGCEAWILARSDWAVAWSAQSGCDASAGVARDTHDDKFVVQDTC
jgi:hypothetical protein